MSNVNEKLAKIAVNKSLLKEYSNTECSRVVYMDNNSEFQIQFFNPYTYTIGADISINGEKMSNRIIIKPGQRIWLERYLDVARKFLFSTYTVENSADALNAIRNNGIVQISFYKEKQNEEIYVYNNWRSPITTYYNCYNFSADNKTNFSSIANSDITEYSDCASYTATTLGINASMNSGKPRCSNKTLNKSSIETGRIEHGDNSNQSFSYMNIDFDYCSFKTETIKILPTSQKPYTDKDLKKIYCSNCGRKLNTKYKFCPYCGNKID